MKRIALLILISFLVGSITAFAGTLDSIPQSKKKVKYNKAQFRELFTQANMMMVENFNDTSLNTFLILHRWDPENANVNFKIGQLYLNSPSEKSKSVSYLESAAPYATRNYVPDEPSEKHCPQLVYYLLGQAYHLTYRFDEAIGMYEKFKKCVNSGDRAAAKDIQRRITISQTAKTFVNSPVKCTITNLGDSINTDRPEYGAVISADESVMYFTSRRFNVETGGNDNRDIYDKYYEDIWYSNKKEDGTWSEAKPVSTHINSWYNEAAIGLSTDGQQLLIYKDDKGGSIYYSKLDGDQWSYAYMLGTDPGDITDINSPAWEPSACFSPDGNTLFFVSNRPGGFGGRDIYKCVKLPTGRWSKATNVGPTINTPYDEDAPFMHPDGVTMFFSSNGHNTMGGFDIYFAMLGDSGWFPAQNMGYPINTTDDDIFYVMSTDGKRAYFSSVRDEGKGDKDIYMITIPQRVVIPVTLIKGYISFLGKRDSMVSYTTISATDVETGTVVQEVHPNSRSMKYILPLNPGRTGKTYSVRYEAEGFRGHTELISVSPTGEYKEVDKDFNFNPLGTISLSGSVLTRSGTSVQGVKITVKDNSTKQVTGIFNTTPEGTFSFDLRGKGGESYALTFEADGFLPMNEVLDLPAAITEFDFKKDVTMETAKMIGTISVSGTVKDKEKNIPKGVRIVVSDNKTGNEAGTYSLDKKGEYYFNLQRGNDYNVSYEADGYLFQSININVPKDKTYSELKKDIVLDKIEKGAKVVLNNIFFDSGKATLRKESTTEIEALVKLMNDQPNIKIEIGGFTDNKGNDNVNLKLSQSRADAVTNALIIKGIDRTRIIPQGYGKEQPIAPNTLPNGKPDLKGMQMNRRVEFKILSN